MNAKMQGISLKHLSAFIFFSLLNHSQKSQLSLDEKLGVMSVIAPAPVDHGHISSNYCTDILMHPYLIHINFDLITQ